MSTRLPLFISVCVLVTTLTSACGAPYLGRRFGNPAQELKVGFDNHEDVVRKLGRPYRRTVDAEGHEMYVYVWADGEGAGEKCVVAFNENGVVYAVEVVP